MQRGSHILKVYFVFYMQKGRFRSREGSSETIKSPSPITLYLISLHEGHCTNKCMGIVHQANDFLGLQFLVILPRTLARYSGNSFLAVNLPTQDMFYGGDLCAAALLEALKAITRKLEKSYYCWVWAYVLGI